MFYNVLKMLGLYFVFGFENDFMRVNCFYVEGFSKVLYGFLKNFIEFLFEVVELYFVEFLRGFFDSEGFLVVFVGKRFRVYVEVVNLNLKLFEFLRKLFEIKFKIIFVIFKMYFKG